MKKPILTIIGAALAVLVIGILLGSSGKGKLRARADAWERTAAIRDSLKDVGDEVQEKQAVELEDEREMRRMVEDRAAGLARRNDELGAENRALILAKIELEEIVAFGAAVETTYVDTSGTRIHAVSFTIDTLGVEVQAETRTPPPTFRATVIRTPPDIRILLQEAARGDWRTTVETPQPWAKLGSLETFIDPLEPTWWERNDFKIGVGLGIVGMLLIFSAIGG